MNDPHYFSTTLNIFLFILGANQIQKQLNHEQFIHLQFDSNSINSLRRNTTVNASSPSRFGGCYFNMSGQMISVSRLGECRGMKLVVNERKTLTLKYRTSRNSMKRIIWMRNVHCTCVSVAIHYILQYTVQSRQSSGTGWYLFSEHAETLHHTSNLRSLPGWCCH